jgi:hypothetical protein
MSGERRPDEVVQDFLASGPEVASAEFVERTMRPIPRMRQRRSWRITLGDIGRPVTAVVGAAAIVAVAVVGLSLVGRLPGIGGQLSPGPSAAPSTAVSLRPSFELVVGEGARARRFVSDPEASVANCAGDDDGSWSVLYAGGDPFVELDLIVGSGADRPGGADRVGAEILADRFGARFDPAVLRGGDAPGRSEATVAVTHDGPATTFIVHAITPDRSTGEDGSLVPISIELTCAPPPA